MTEVEKDSENPKGFVVPSGITIVWLDNTRFDIKCSRLHKDQKKKRNSKQSERKASEL